MIRVDFLIVGAEPTLWIHTESQADFAALCTMFSDLAHGTTDSVETISKPNLFKRMPGVDNLIFSVVPSAASSHLPAIARSARDVVWSVPRHDWGEVLKRVQDMPPHRHNYIEYPEATVSISYMEKLREGV